MAAPETPHAGGSQQPTSLTLLDRLRANDGDAWHTMVRLYTPLVRHWCDRSGVRRADGDDVAQDVFRAAALSMEAFRRDRPGDSFRGWLRGITRNMVLQHFRHAGKQPRAAGGTDIHRRLESIADTDAGDDDEDPAEELDGLRRRALDLVRGEFESRTWQAFWRTVVDDAAPVDVAAELGTSAAAVRMAKSRVLRRLKEEFGDLVQ
jgi:RNA polymerase sigma-70 factor (ECF subfamily)